VQEIPAPMVLVDPAVLLVRKVTLVTQVVQEIPVLMVLVVQEALLVLLALLVR
jgi:hypothetical protein